MPEHSREPRTALALLESEMLLDGDPSKNLATRYEASCPGEIGGS